MSKATPKTMIDSMGNPIKPGDLIVTYTTRPTPHLGRAVVGHDGRYAWNDTYTAGDFNNNDSFEPAASLVVDLATFKGVGNALKVADRMVRAAAIDTKSYRKSVRAFFAALAGLGYVEIDQPDLLGNVKAERAFVINPDFPIIDKRWKRGHCVKGASTTTLIALAGELGLEVTVKRLGSYAEGWLEVWLLPLAGGEVKPFADPREEVLALLAANDLQAAWDAFMAQPGKSEEPYVITLSDMTTDVSGKVYRLLDLCHQERHQTIDIDDVASMLEGEHARNHVPLFVLEGWKKQLIEANFGSCKMDW